MIKTSVIALATVAMLGVSAPAMAGTMAVADNSGIHGYSESTLLSRFQDRGIEATHVESWGQWLRVNVVLDDGSNAVQIYTPDSLNLVFG